MGRWGQAVVQGVHSPGIHRLHSGWRETRFECVGKLDVCVTVFLSSRINICTISFTTVRSALLPRRRREGEGEGSW